MFTHVTLGSNDLARSRRFYDATITALGGPAGEYDEANQRLTYTHNGAMLVVLKPINGQPACHANGGTIGLASASPEMSEAWHAAGVANGGTTCENPPGVREFGPARIHLAYLRDPDGNKLCTLHVMG